jgi:hypothetical protein
MPLHHVERRQQLTDQRQNRPQQRALIWPGLTVPFIGRAADAALETNEKSGGGPEAEDRETEVCHQAPAAPSQQIARARVRISPPARRHYGSIALVSSGLGAGSAFGVAPSISCLPPGWTMMRRKTISVRPPP